MKILLALMTVIFVSFYIPDIMAVDFVDRTGYMPEWAKNMGQQQALMACLDTEYKSQDQNWCLEFSGYMMDRLDAQQGLGSFDFEQIPEESQYTPQNNFSMFEGAKGDKNTYVNKIYDFSITPPQRWQKIENAELMGGQEAAVVAFYSNIPHNTYTANFIAVYSHMTKSEFDLLRYYSDQEVLDEVLWGFAFERPTARIMEKKIESYIDGYKIYLKFADTLKINKGTFTTLQSESIIHVLDNGDVYFLNFASSPEHFDKEVLKFHESAKTFLAGSIDVADNIQTTTLGSEQRPICGEGTIEKGGICIPAKQQSSESRGGGCLIATAAYGTELAPAVQTMRELRNHAVLGTNSGSSFMVIFNTMYYSFSPTIADWERQNPLFKEIIKMTITPMLSTLSILSYLDIESEQEMLGYGVVIILLNLGIYFIVPAIIILKIKRHLS